MADAFIFDHVRTPRGRGKTDGSLHGITPIQLAAQTLAAVRDRSGLDTRSLDDVVLGCVSPVGEQGSDIARVAALVAGFDQQVPGKQLNRFCASGLEAVNTAAAQIMAGQSDLVIGGGVESMSRVPIGSDGGALFSDPAVTYQTYFTPQGIGADLIATLDGYSREMVDDYALESQRRAAAAWSEHRFARSMVAVKDQIGEVALDRDEYMRPNTTREDLAALKPAFAVPGDQAGFDAVAIQRYPQIEAVRHVHTAGNSSGIVDGAAAVLVGARKMAGRIGRAPRARIRGFASIGSEPTIMLTGPAGAARKVLKRTRMSVADIDLFEINEAFAVVAMAAMRDLDLPHDKVNVHGGACALGHPIGASGARILVTLISALEQYGLRRGVASLCIGGGEATAIAVELCR